MKRQSSESFGVFLLVLLVFVTPTSEALKNILIASLFIWWLSAGRIRRELLTAPLYVHAIALFAVLPLVTTFTSDISDTRDLLLNAKGPAKLVLITLPVYSLAIMRKGEEKSTAWITTALVLGGLAAYVDAFISWDMTAATSWKDTTLGAYPKLRNMGAANPTAIYVMLVLVSAIALTSSDRVSLAISGWLAFAASLGLLAIMRSFNALAVLLCTCILWTSILIIENRRKMLIRTFAGLGITVLGLVSIAPSLDRHLDFFNAELNHRIYSGNITSHRLHIFRTALEIHDQHLWLGFGASQFGKATSAARLRAELAAEGRSYEQERDKFYHITDGHNTFVNTLVERGLLGVILVALFFVSSAFHILKHAVRIFSRAIKDPHMAQLMLLSGGTWITLFVGGIAQTTLIDDHGLLGLVLLIWSISALEFRSAASEHGSSKR